MTLKFGVVKIEESTLKEIPQGTEKSIGTVKSGGGILPVFAGIDKTVETEGDPEDIIVKVEYFIGYTFDDTTPQITYTLRAFRGDTSAGTYSCGAYSSMIPVGSVQIAYPEGTELITEVVHIFATT